MIKLYILFWINLILSVDLSVSHSIGSVVSALSIDFNDISSNKSDIRKLKKLKCKNTFKPLPDSVSETSGLIFFNNLWWTINDSGGQPCLYSIDPKSGTVNNYITISNSTNVDWEEITQDSLSIYIGDFGNNNGNRKNLVIYKINKNHFSNETNQMIPAEKIYFEYSDQLSFETRKFDNDYDCEAMVYFKDSLYLFSKNWINHKTRIYRLPKNPGKYKAELIDSIDTGFLITGATISSDYKHLLLIGYRKGIKINNSFLWHIREFNGTKFSNGDRKKYRLKLKLSQTEAICFKVNEVYFTREVLTKYITIKQAMFKLNTKTLFDYPNAK